MTAVLDLVLRSVALLILTGAAAWMLRRRGAAVQALVLTAALAGVLALPLAAAALPAWPVTLWAVRAETPALTPDSPQIAAFPANAVTSVRTAAPASAEVGESVTSTAATANAPAAPLAIAAATMTWVMAIWAGGVTLLGARLVYAHLALARLVRRCDARVAPEWPALAAGVARELGVRRPVTVRTSAEVGVPIVTGVRRPVLLVPAESEEWPIEVRRDVIRHELAHVARWDAVGQIVCHLACALHWFNPLVWLAASRASMLRERACDDVVLRAGTKASAYAACLLDLASGGGRDRAGSAALAMARASRIRERIVGVLDPGARREAPGPIATVGVIAAALVGVAAVGTFEPAVRAEASADVSISSPIPSPAVTPAPAAAAAPTNTLASSQTTATSRSQSSSSTKAISLKYCDGQIKSHSNSTNDNGRERSWKLRIEGTDCDIRLDARGSFEFNDAFTDVARIDRDGSFLLEIRDHGVRKSLDIASTGSGLTHTYKVDGREQPWDAAAQAWFAELLIDLDRLTAVGVDHRFPRLYQQGGVKAVLAETALMPGDYARSRYYEKLLGAARLTPDERRAIIEQSAQMTRSDYYSTELLKRVVAQGRLQDPQERAAAIALIERMSSDYYRSVVIAELGGSLSTDQLTALLKVAATIDSDHYRGEVLKRVLSAGTLSAAQQALVLGAVGDMDSDYYKTDILKLLAGGTMDGVEARKAYLGAAYSIDSGFYRQEALSAFVRRNDLGEADLLGVVDAARGASDHYRAEILVDVLRNRGVSERVRQVVRDAAQSLSNSYRLRVYDAIGR